MLKNKKISAMDLELHRRDSVFFESKNDDELNYSYSEEDNKEDIVALRSYPHLTEASGVELEYKKCSPFSSWEFSVKNFPGITFFPFSVSGIKNIVTWAGEHHLRIRASGYRHSSSDVFAESGQVLISLLDERTVTALPTVHTSMNSHSDLQYIRLASDPYEIDGQDKIRCKIGAATCNYHFQEWVHSPYGGNAQWAMPLNVIMTEISFGGSNAMMCHGAGIGTKTISDLVKEIEFVNVKGELQTVSDPVLLQAASGCFGLLGIVTALTLELDKMTWARLNTAEKRPLVAAIPPSEDGIPEHVRAHLSRTNRALLKNPKALDDAFKYFVDCCEKNYYAEWFWFPLQDKCWVNCWNNDGDSSHSRRYPSKTFSQAQSIMTYLSSLANSVVGDNTPTFFKKIQAKLTGSLAMKMMPNRQNIVCTLEDAIHFQTGIHNFKTRMMEIQIPIPDIAETGNPDWRICQKAWWSLHDVFYTGDNLKKFPMRTTLEMRIMGGTDHVLMASQYGNKRTCCIEVLTPVAVNEHVWNEFMQQILDKWAMLRDNDGRYLNIRPHWAKRFDHLFINRDHSWRDEWDNVQREKLDKYVKEEGISIPMREYLKYIAYKDQIISFLKKMDLICEQGGYTLNYIQERFSNPLLDDLIFDKKHNALEEKSEHSTVSSHVLLNKAALFHRNAKALAEKIEHDQPVCPVMNLK